MAFLDDAPGTLAYRDLTPAGPPVSRVFVKTTLAAGALVSVSASHELVEMPADPAGDGSFRRSYGRDAEGRNWNSSGRSRLWRVHTGRVHLSVRPCLKRLAARLGRVDTQVTPSTLPTQPRT